MSIKDKLKIYLITYNRKKYLERTLKQILAPESPIKDFDITVLDNASSDGSSELIEEYCEKYSNLVHIRHKVNIGGNANICRAFELGASSGKEYVWVLCDDDKYDFSNWRSVENEIEKKTDVICCSNYICDTPEKQLDPKYQVFQLTFVPAGIYRTELISDSVLINMYDSIYTMFQQACITIDAINDNKKIKVLKTPIVHNGLHEEDACTEYSYSRGSKKNVLKRRKDTIWILGYVNILSLLEDESKIPEYLEVAIPYKDIYGSFASFYFSLSNTYFNFEKFSYLLEIYQKLSSKRKTQMFLYLFLNFLSPVIFYTTPRGLFVKLFYKIKIKILPFKNDKDIGEK